MLAFAWSEAAQNQLMVDRDKLEQGIYHRKASSCPFTARRKCSHVRTLIHPRAAWSLAGQPLSLLRRPSSLSIMAVLHRLVILCGSLLYPGHIVLTFQLANQEWNLPVSVVRVVAWCAGFPHGFPKPQAPDGASKLQFEGLILSFCRLPQGALSVI